MRLSVVIPALNESACIGRAVQSAWLAGAGEVIVADGGSRDDTASRAAQFGAEVVIVAPASRARQQNAGAEIAGGDVLLFLHADNHLHADVGRQIADAMRRDRAQCGAFRQRIEADGLAYRWLEAGNAQRVRWLGMPYGDQAIFARRQWFRDAGGFPPVPLLEDLIFMRRLRRRSWPVLLPGPVFVSPRRWQQHGLLRQTLRNWSILLRFACGSPPDQLARLYRRHDQS